MEKKGRIKYYPINLKDKKLHNEFMILERQREDKNVDETLERLLADYRLVGQLQEQNNLLRVELSDVKKKIRGHEGGDDLNHAPVLEGKYTTKVE